MNPSCVFLAFSISNGSVSDYFSTLAIRFAETSKVVIFTDTDGNLDGNENIITYRWKSKRPTQWQDYKQLTKAIRLHKPHLMISVFGSVNMFTLGGFMCGVNSRIAWCRTLRGQIKTKQIGVLRKRLIYTLCTHVFTNSEATKRDVMEHFGVSERKLKVVPNAVKEYPITRGKVKPYTLVYAGRLDPAKGIDTLLNALPMVVKKHPQTQLSILGGSLTGNVIKTYQKQVHDLQLDEYVNFLGGQNKQTVLETFAHSYATVVPSVLEAFGFVVIESFSVKTPVIGSNTSGIAESVRHQKDGLLFEPQNAVDLASQITYLFDHPTMRGQFGDNCYERFLECYELQQAVDNVLELLKKEQLYV